MKVLSMVVSVLLAGCVQAAVRPAAVAGSFYPGSEAELRTEVEGLLEAAGRGGPRAVALVVPHAGYVFSGPTAASGYATLAEARRVILLGPSHHRGFSGGALPAANVTAFATPLGQVAIDRDAVARLRNDADFQGPETAHDPEHSLEVQLPFLQVVAPQARIVPVLLGYQTDRSTCQRMAHTIAKLLENGAVVIASSDFTHHGEGYRWAPYAGSEGLGDLLVGLGRSTASRAAAGDVRGFWHQVEVSGDTVCGARPIQVLTELAAHALRGEGKVLAVTTSGHVVKDWSRSVTYATVTFEGGWTGWKEDPDPPALGELGATAEAAVVSLARATLRSHLMHDDSLAQWFAGHTTLGPLLAPAGAFVTVNNTGARARTHGRLRACMGVIEAREPLVDAVIHAAVSAAHDPRFPALEAAELEAVDLEVSVLMPSRRVAGPEQVVVGRHGVVLRKAGRQAVFLPQVAPEQGWDRDTMLDHLALKAGLPRDGWRKDATFEVFEAQVAAEVTE